MPHIKTEGYNIDSIRQLQLRAILTVYQTFTGDGGVNKKDPMEEIISGASSDTRQQFPIA